MSLQCRRSLRRPVGVSSSRQGARGSIFQTRNLRSSHVFSSIYTYVYHNFRSLDICPVALAIDLNLRICLPSLQKGDYYPRLLHNKRRNSWELEDAVSSPNPENPGGRGSVEATTYISSVREHLLKDTVIYCAAEKYGLEELKRLALKKQGLQSGIEVATILRSARYAYDNTPDTDSRLRAHYLALIIRCRKTFKRSGTMQTEMESGGKLFFDLFVALCNHVDDIVEMGNAKSPKTI
ncbi:hypothetical protein ONS95_009808 [Cadophora gregata]|uniref:uncharacterized protein n=1 Tax=Cadophora gregata TaxID=51156 RepID=UPI0026DB21C7|nr:uncharacterized protein ONS95_009808 [Cadophora gregata]KAK0121516.1 hypothetical protein ONS95_009808 [Cadophora gregata]KAK0126993.1 hypothetical protein ONS96_006553 [Cadophora gregata f. sp. sojae]